MQPGDVVVDLGCGTGILGLLACEAGAGRVYCIDEGPMLDVARRVAAQCGFAERFSFLAGHSQEVELPELADLVVADQMSPFGVGAGLLESFADARRRFLKPAGCLLPCALELWLAGVIQPAFRAQFAAIERNVQALDFDHFEHLLLNDPRCLSIAEEHVWTRPALLASIDLGSAEPDLVSGSVSLTATRAGMLDGLGGWFVSNLATGIECTNSPLDPNSIGRSCLFLPFEKPIDVTSGETLLVNVTVSSRRVFYAWHVRRLGVDGTEKTVVKQSSLVSNLLSRRLLSQSDPMTRPRLNRRGLMRHAVFDLAAQGCTLAEIASRIYSEHAQVLRSRDRALELVIDELRSSVE